MARALPGYGLVHDIAATVLGSLLGPKARVLVVGAGTGTDILRLGGVHPGWRFVGVDPAADMLAVAPERFAAHPGLAERVQLVEGSVAALDPNAPLFDAALCLLVTHFLPDTPQGKAALLRETARRLRPQAPLLLADFSAPYDGLPAPALLETAWVHWQRERDLSEEAIERGLAYAQRAIAPVTPARLAALLAETGFGPPQRVMQALHVHGWLTHRETTP
ncbi:class I SAM-dependent methyltransferase [Pararhodospirillum photometricum]|uniref:Methyltransferase type 12 domain-containing protein n=1 Tax=Pararhodospirillum photometricum DSM 122 TaxID=1150469 RepID=H6SLK6_PARPM|nr:class I SAM-dependent methyltransferase [Pararhodospirillum photometricum]CCG08871.1 Putative uncharacterized protein [Pararhodospirillum photometricum DSM 122]